jgi:hypothetical protein
MRKWQLIPVWTFLFASVCFSPSTSIAADWKDKPEGGIMSIKLNHTILPAKNKAAAAKFRAQLFGLSYTGPAAQFISVAWMAVIADG